MKEPNQPRPKTGEAAAELHRGLFGLQGSLGQGAETLSALEEARKAFVLFCEDAPVSYQLLDDQARLVAVSREWLRLFGYAREEVIGTSFLNFVTPGSKSAFQEQFRRLTFSEPIVGQELELVRKEGAQFSAAVSGNRVPGETDASEYLLLTLRDITEDKRIQRSIERAKREWEYAFDAVPDLVAILDEDFRVVRMNKTMAARLGVDIRDAIGKHCYELVHGRDEPPPFCPLGRLLEDGEEHAVEIFEPRMGGTFMVTASPVYDERGRLTGSVHVARDITDRKTAEEELRKARDELETRVRERTGELREANELLKEKISTIDQLYEHVLQSTKAKVIAEHTAEVAHELRQPLAIIGGFARRLARRLGTGGASDPGAQDEFALIASEVERLERILGGLIEFSRRESIGLQCVNPNALIEEVVRVNAPRTQEKELLIALDLDPAVGEILLDPDLFGHVVRNLVANAIEASPVREVVIVETRISLPSDAVRESADLTSEAYFQLKIQNRGEPISSEELEKIFNPFYTTKSYGTGLGLTLSKKIIEDHRGSISVKSSEQGTLFTVWLPMGRKEATRTPDRKLNILVMDRGQPLLKLLRRELAKAGHTVMTALSGPEGLELFESHPPDMIVCDYGLPGLGGWEMSGRIKARCESLGIPKTPFVLTVGVGDGERAEGRTSGSGVDAVVEKPLDLSQLLDVIRRLGA
ncbi:MAG: PAS domain S-box protein [Desulfomonile tiedjei]|nr:PAS domain S-box protein [Desulfomonile tiedjei]